VEKQNPGVVAWGPALMPQLEEQQGCKGGREESKSQVEGVLGFFSLSFFFFYFL
jgi:hypothetical protein